MKNQPMVGLVLKAIGLAMGVAVVVLSVLNTATVQTMVSLLGIGLFAVALAMLAEGKT